MNRIKILRQEQTLAAAEADGEVMLYFQGEYQSGDRILMESDAEHVVVSVDHAVPVARLYLPNHEWTFHVPLSGDLPRSYPPFAFAGDRHLLCLKEDTGSEYRNLACNPADQRQDSGAFPHVTANVETRDESIFFARNVIDGLHIADGHGSWPYGSWGIGRSEEAAIRIDFGREVRVDKMTLYLRADFEHSGAWKGGVLRLSDGYEKNFLLEKIDGPQLITLNGFHTFEWAQLHRFSMGKSLSPYPSLRQWEIYGQDADAEEKFCFM